MKKQKDNIMKDVSRLLIGLFANVFLWFLIWGGAVMAWVNADEPFLGLLLVFAGLAKLYQEYRKFKIK